MPSHGLHLLTKSDDVTKYGDVIGGYLNKDKLSIYGDMPRGWQSIWDEMYPSGKIIGSSNLHNNISPYYAINMWVRIS